MTITTKVTAENLVLCESSDGWSLHAPGSTDEQIATGDAPYILSGAGQPTAADYDEALRRWWTAVAEVVEWRRLNE